MVLALKISHSSLLVFASCPSTFYNDLQCDNQNSLGIDLIIHGSDFYVY